MRLFPELTAEDSAAIKQHLQTNNQIKLKRGTSATLPGETDATVFSHSYIAMTHDAYILAHDSARTAGEQASNRAVLGAGSFGRVKWVKSLTTGKRQVVKISSGYYQRSESRILLDLGLLLDQKKRSDRRKHYAVLKYCGDALALYLPRNQQALTDSKRFDIAIKFMLALSRLHDGHLSKQAVAYQHGDIKPSNCCVASDGTVTLVDYGLASELSIESTTLFEGTSRYMPSDDEHGYLPYQTDVLAAKRSLYVPDSFWCAEDYVGTGENNLMEQAIFNKAFVDRHGIFPYVDTGSNPLRRTSGVHECKSAITLAAILVAAQAQAAELYEAIDDDEVLARAVVALSLECDGLLPKELKADLLELKSDQAMQKKLALLQRFGLETHFSALVDDDALMIALNKIEKIMRLMPQSLKRLCLLAARRLILASVKRLGLDDLPEAVMSIWSAGCSNVDQIQAIMAAPSMALQLFYSFVPPSRAEAPFLHSQIFEEVFANDASIPAQAAFLLACEHGDCLEALMLMEGDRSALFRAVCFLVEEYRGNKGLLSELIAMAIDNSDYCRWLSVVDDEMGIGYEARRAKGRATLMLQLGMQMYDEYRNYASSRVTVPLLKSIHDSRYRQQIIKCINANMIKHPAHASIVGEARNESAFWTLPLIEAGAATRSLFSEISRHTGLRNSLNCPRLYINHFYSKPVVMALLTRDVNAFAMVKFLRQYCTDSSQLAQYAQLIGTVSTLPNAAAGFKAVLAAYKLQLTLSQFATDYPDCQHAALFKERSNGIVLQMKHLASRLAQRRFGTEADNAASALLLQSITAINALVQSMPDEAKRSRRPDKYYNWPNWSQRCCLDVQRQMVQLQLAHSGLRTAAQPAHCCTIM